MLRSKPKSIHLARYSSYCKYISEVNPQTPSNANANAVHEKATRSSVAKVERHARRNIVVRSVIGVAVDV